MEALLGNMATTTSSIPKLEAPRPLYRHCGALHPLALQVTSDGHFTQTSSRLTSYISSDILPGPKYMADIV